MLPGSAVKPLRILTWHVHGSYLFNLVQVPFEFFLPIRPGRPEGYGGRSPGLPWPPNVHDVEVEEVPRLSIDCVLFQSRRNWIEDRRILSEEQLRLPRIYLEHDPPRESPTGTRHPVDDPGTLLVHVTPFNDLMWDPGRTPTRVIDHGVIDRGPLYSGEVPRGITVVNGLASRGRRLGLDVFLRAREEVPIDLAGMGSKELGGLGEVSHADLPGLEARYRFFFNPIRYTSLGLSVCEAMMAGMPSVGLATTEMATAVESGVSGWVDTDTGNLVLRMRDLLADPLEARRLGDGARRRALERFHISRFVRDWIAAFEEVAGKGRGGSTLPSIVLSSST